MPFRELLLTVTSSPEHCPALLKPLYEAMETVVVGRRGLLDRFLIALAIEGHVLLESLPGLAKTLAVQTLAHSVQLSFRRVQFTPDLLPADILGTQIYNATTAEFTLRRGPIFTQVLLADEINRAPAKVQSALLEAMQERRVSLAEQTFDLPRPFFVLATQNPIDQEGTYPLPEAQLDRFAFKLTLDYPTRDEELEILERMGRVEPMVNVPAVFTYDDLVQFKTQVEQVYVDEKVKGYVVDLVRATRERQPFGLDWARWVEYGASPRAVLILFRAAKAWAFLQGRGFVTPADVKAMAPDVLRHRLILSYEAEADDLKADILISKLLDAVPIP